MRHAIDVETQPEYRSAHAEHRALSRIDGQGGYAVPPIWMMQDFVELARPGRLFANAVTNATLPPGTDILNVPKMLTGPKTGAQNGYNTNVVSQDPTDASIQAPVRTIAGQVDVARQLIDQSPLAFDQLIFSDLVADYSSRLDSQCLVGTGTNGTLLGVLGTSGIISVPAGALTIGSVYAAIANGIQQIHGVRHQPPQAIFMHPRRWGFFQSLLDTTNRPLFVPVSQNPMNAAGILINVASEQVVGNMQGVPIITDPNIPTTLGSGSPTGDEDPVPNHPHKRPGPVGERHPHHGLPPDISRRVGRSSVAGCGEGGVTEYLQRCSDTLL